jgi:uncharacterized protein (DUF2342 family)
MTNTPFTARNVAKFVVTSAIAAKASDTTEDAITSYTSLEEDDLIVVIGSKVAGWCIADAVKPYTDKMVDKTADFVNTKREARKAKKNAK